VKAEKISISSQFVVRPLAVGTCPGPLKAFTKGAISGTGETGRKLEKKKCSR
jgi:hypothetical protein